MKKCKIVFIALLLLLMFVPGIVLFVKKDKTFSDLENRTLSVRPTPTVTDVLSGKTESELTDFVTDQFIFRDFLMKVQTEYKKLLGAKDVGGVYFAKNGFLLDKISDNDISFDAYEKNLLKVKEFFEENGNVKSSVLLVPSPSVMLKDYLPKNATFYNDEMYYKKAMEIFGSQFVYIKDGFKEAIDSEAKNGEVDKYYFKTDHHYTTYGAYLAYKLYMESMGVTPRSIEEFGLKDTGKTFYGTLYSKAADFRTKPDEFIVPTVNESDYKVIGGKGVIYDLEAMDRKDKYTLYFGGNFGTIIIEGNNNTGRNLMIVKDSYANSLLPYMLKEYDKIVVVDPRFFTGSISTLMSENEINEVLFFYEMGNFINDTEMRRMLMMNK